MNVRALLASLLLLALAGCVEEQYAEEDPDSVGLESDDTYHDDPFVERGNPTPGLDVTNQTGDPNQDAGPEADVGHYGPGQ